MQRQVVLVPSLPSSGVSVSLEALPFATGSLVPIGTNETAGGGELMPQLACAICGQSFSKQANLTRHLKVHNGEKPFACPACSYHATRKEHLEKHFTRMHPTGIPPSLVSQPPTSTAIPLTLVSQPPTSV